MKTRLAPLLLLLALGSTDARAQALPTPLPAAPETAGFSFTARFEDDLATQEWTLIKSGPLPRWQPPGAWEAMPLQLYLNDVVTGARAAMIPAAYFVTEGRQRWGGRALGVDWVLVLDGATNEQLSVSGQFKAATPRALTLEAGLALNLAGWTWHDGPRHTTLLQSDTPRCWSVTPSSLGRSGQQSLYPIAVISQPERALELEAGLEEPRVFQLVVDPPASWLGIHFDLALDPRTIKFPGRTTFRFVARTQATGGSASFRAAWQRYQQHNAPAFACQLGQQGLNYNPDALAQVDFPLVFAHGDSRPGAVAAATFDIHRPAQPTFLDAPTSKTAESIPVPQQERLREAGWRPLGELRVREEGINLDEFGAATSLVRHLVLSTTSAWPQIAHIILPPSSEPHLLVDPQSGSVEEVGASSESNEWLVALEPGIVTMRELFPWSALEAVRDFYRSNVATNEEESALAENLDTLAKAHELAAQVQLVVERPALTTSDHPIQLVISNQGLTELNVRDVYLAGTTGPQALLATTTTLSAGSNLVLSGFLDHSVLSTPACRLNLTWTMERNGTVVDGHWTERLAVAEPIFVALSTQALVTVDDQIDLPVYAYNRFREPVSVKVSAQGDFSASEILSTIAPGEQQRMELNVASTEPRLGRMRVMVAAGDRSCLERELQMEFLDPYSSFARDTRVRVQVSSTSAEESSENLRDGDRATGWSSVDEPVTHWVRYDFPEPTAVSEVTLVWPQPAGNPIAGLRGTLRGVTATGEELALASYSNAIGQAETRVEFGTVQLKSLELSQPPGGGAPDQPNLLWLNELEVR